MLLLLLFFFRFKRRRNFNMSESDEKLSKVIKDMKMVIDGIYR